MTPEMKSPPDEDATELKTISVDNLSFDPQQSRTSKESRVDEAFLDSIEKHGVINPLTVREKDTKSPETNDRKGTPEAPAGDQEYYIVAGRRRFHAAVEVGLLEIDCIVRDYTDEEAAAVSIEENDQRIDLSQFEIARAIKKRYDILAEDLVPEEGEVECIVDGCDSTLKGRQGLKTHLQMKHEGFTDSVDPFLGKEEIYEQIAESHDFEITTVRDLIKVASIPKQFRPFVKVHKERHPKESDRVEELLPEGFTFVNEDSNATVSQKVIDFARFASNHPERLVELTLERRDIHRMNTSELSDMFRSISEAWDAWEDEIGENGVTETSAYHEALTGEMPPEEDEEEESEEENESEKKEEESNTEEETEETIEQETVNEEPEEDTVSPEPVENDDEPEERTEWITAKIKLTEGEKEEAIATGSLTISEDRIEWGSPDTEEQIAIPEEEIDKGILAF